MISGRCALLAMTIAAAAQANPPDPFVFDSGLDNQVGLTFSPDGNTAYWAAWNGAWGADPSGPRTIYFSRLADGGWSAAETVSFSGTFNDDDPYVSPDGRWLYFVSDRPGPGGDADRDFDIWRYRLGGDGAVQRLDVNSDADEYSPVVTDSGTLYFASARDAGLGQGDLYRAAAAGEGFAPAELLGPAVNTPTGEWNLWVSADDSEILFEASSRPDNVTVSGDLYYSWRTPAGWTAAVHVSELNSRGSDLMPRLHPDGETLYYASAAMGGHASIVATPWPPLREKLRARYAPLLLVANRSSHDVAFVDLAAGQVVRRVATGEGPHLLSNVEDGRMLATGFGEFPQPHAEPVSKRPPFQQALNSRLTLIDIADGSVLLETTLEDCERPHASWITGDRGFVTCQDERAILEIDIDNGEPLRRFDSRQDGTHVLRYDAHSGVLAASNVDSGSVTLLDIASGTTRIVPLAAGSEGSVEAGGQFWVANGWHGSVSVVDAGTAEVVAQTEALCNFPIALSPDNRNRIWIACFGSAELLAIGRDSYEVVERYALDGQPLHLLVHPTRDLAYAALPRENAVAEIDLATGRVLRKVRSGIEPDGLRWAR